MDLSSSPDSTIISQTIKPNDSFPIFDICHNLFSLKKSNIDSLIIYLKHFYLFYFFIPSLLLKNNGSSALI